MKIKIAFCLLIGLSSTAAIASAQTVPKEVWGKWVVRRELPTTTISCWGEPEARKIIGSEIEYSEKVFRWNSIITNDPVAESKIITAQQFHDENSGGSVNSSQVDFRQLGIKQARTTEIRIQHTDAHISAATNEIPGDNILMKDTNTIVLSICNIFFEAKRVSGEKLG
jgi:hypothetical protein